MTKTNIEKLQELQERAYYLINEKPKEIAKALQSEWRKNESNIMKDNRYTIDFKTEVLQMEREALRNDVMKKLKVLGDEYEQNRQEMLALREKIETEFESKFLPTASERKMFDTELTELKTYALLSNNADATIKSIEQFLGRHDNAHLLSELKKEFAQLASATIKINNDAETRQELTKLFEKISTKAVPIEVREARKIVGNIKEKPTFYLQSSPFRAVITNIIGRDAGAYLNNPHEYEAE